MNRKIKIANIIRLLSALSAIYSLMTFWKSLNTAWLGYQDLSNQMVLHAVMMLVIAVILGYFATAISKISKNKKRKAALANFYESYYYDSINAR